MHLTLSKNGKLPLSDPRTHCRGIFGKPSFKFTCYAHFYHYGAKPLLLALFSRSHSRILIRIFVHLLIRLFIHIFISIFIRLFISNLHLIYTYTYTYTYKPTQYGRSLFPCGNFVPFGENLAFSAGAAAFCYRSRILIHILISILIRIFIYILYIS